jgi:tetratricopeptide (TPR) repeat protein
MQLEEGMDLELDPKILMQKGRRAGRAAIISCFLLACFWSLDPFFIWIFLGAAVYSGFLVWFYARQARPAELAQERWVEPEPGRPGPGRINRAWIFILASIAFFIVTVIARALLSASTGNDDSPLIKSESDPGNNELDALMNRGNDFYSDGKFDSALSCYNRVLVVDPENQAAQYDKALVYYAQKDYRKPVPLLLNCLRKYPDYGEAYWLLGDVYIDRHNPDSAKICFAYAYLKGIRDGSFLQLMASFYEVDEKFKAAELYRESLEHDSSLVESYRKLIKLDPARAEEYQRMLAKWSKK